MNTRTLTLICIPALCGLVGGCTTPFGTQPRTTAPAAGGPGTQILEVTTPAELPTIPEHFRMRFPQLRPEMSIEEFKALFPEAYFTERKHQADGGAIDAYELCVRQRYRFPNDPQVYIQSGKAWFYFTPKGLESWGEPSAWPPTTAPPRAP